MSRIARTAAPRTPGEAPAPRDARATDLLAGRRQTLATLTVALAAGPLVLWATAADHAALPDGHFSVAFTDAEWRARLTPAAYRVLREGATERPFSSPFAHPRTAGIYACAGCGRALFDARDQFDSGTGWPSFTRPIVQGVGDAIDRGWLTIRVAVHCLGCGGHLGHVFQDGPPPTGLRYCINGASLEVLAA